MALDPEFIGHIKAFTDKHQVIFKIKNLYLFRMKLTFLFYLAGLAAAIDKVCSLDIDLRDRHSISF